MIWTPSEPTCPAHMDDHPDGLQCQRPIGHVDGHAFTASDAPDRHTNTEARDE